MVYTCRRAVNQPTDALHGLNHQEADQLEVFEPGNLTHQGAGFARREQAIHILLLLALALCAAVVLAVKEDW
jgi:hypothetical protein